MQLAHSLPSNASEQALQASDTATGHKRLKNRACSFPLLALPIDILRRILTHADVVTLSALSETSHRLLNEVYHEALWKHISVRRFRVTPRIATSRRLQAAGGVSWRTLYANWHLQGRMPISRHSGPNINAFAKGRAGGAFAWMTVPSTNDCRLRNGAMRFRVVIQNVSATSISVRPTSVAISLQNAGVIVPGVCASAGCVMSVSHTVFDRAVGKNGNRHVSSAVLSKDDFIVISAHIKMCGTVFEIDVLERIKSLIVPIIADGCRFNVECPMSDRHIWDSYELLPGGWWARVG